MNPSEEYNEEEYEEELEEEGEDNYEENEDDYEDDYDNYEDYGEDYDEDEDDEDDYDGDLTEDFGFATNPSLTYNMKWDKGVFFGKCDGEESIKQAVYKILSTERYEHEIYSWDYGIELSNLIGKDFEYMATEIPDRIEEALLQDDRIEAVENFEVEQTGRRLAVVRFTVTSTEGVIPIEREVAF